MNKNAQKFKDWHWKIYQNYLAAAIHLDIWWLLHDAKYIKFVRNNKTFFLFDASAHLIAGTLAITKIFDHDPKSINLEKFLKFSLDRKEDIESVFPRCKFCNDRISRKINNKIDSLKESLSLIKKWRNKAIAHQERRFESSPIKWKHFQNIIDFLEEHFLDYGTEPNQIFSRADNLVPEIERIFDKNFRN